MSESNSSAKDTHEKRNELWNQSIDHHRQYIDESTGLFCAKHVEQRCCPVCEANNAKPIFDKEGGTYVICSDCSMVYLNPVFTDASLEHFYANNHTAQSEIVDDDLSFYHQIYSAGLDLASHFLADKQHLLDFGCSSGNFLSLAQQKGWKDTVGVELNMAEAKIAQNKGHQIYNSLSDLMTKGRKFDLISLWDVFEHLKDGKESLRQFKKMLSPSGLLLLQVPNAASLAASIMHEKCNMFDGLEHVNLYSPKTITAIANQCGYDILAIDTVISEINVLHNHLHYEHGYTGSQPATDTILPGIDEDYIFQNKLGYKLQVVLK
tara:strand:- start:7099 stop:8061 length:963 start_codon:yes stop_codon:yes gene_type:complete